MSLADYWNRGAQTGGLRPNTSFSWINPAAGVSKMVTDAASMTRQSLPSMGSIFTQNQNVPMVAPKAPEMGVSYDPPTSVPMVAGGGLIGSGNNLPATGVSYEPPPSANIPMTAGGGLVAPGVNTPKPEVSYQPPTYSNPQPPTDTNIPYATFENLQSYFNPYYQFLMDEGTRQIQGSAAAKGRLQSSKTINEIGNWSNQAGAQAFEGALDSFFRDRGDMYGMMKDSRDFDWAKYVYGNNFGYGMYQDELAGYNANMKSFYDMMSDIAGVGINASNRAGDLSADSSTALANLFMAMAQMQAMGGTAGAQQQGDFLGSLISLVPTLLGLGGK